MVLCWGPGWLCWTGCTVSILPVLKMAPGLKKCVTICSWKRGAIFKSVSFDLPWVCFHELYENQNEAFIH